LGLELHLALFHKQVNELRPDAVIIDPISNFGMIGDYLQIKALLMRIVDFLKSRQVTCLITSLTVGGEALEQTDAGISSLVDTWLLLRGIERGAKRDRYLYLLKSRGMAHSNEMRQFRITNRGIRLADAAIDAADIHAESSRTARNEDERVRAATSHGASNRRRAAAAKRRD
jgi:circadian clock protein KaiC